MPCLGPLHFTHYLLSIPKKYSLLLLRKYTATIYEITSKEKSVYTIFRACLLNSNFQSLIFGPPND